MRTRVAAAMIAFVLLLFPLGTFMLVSRCFDLVMERERNRALSEEAAIARAVAMEIRAGDKEQVFTVAQGLQSRYGSEELDVMLVYHGAAMAGRTLPKEEQIETLLGVDGRSTLLSGDTQTLYIAHRLDEALVLLIGTDVSPVYGLRRELSVWAGAFCVVSAALSSLLAYVVSGWLVRPVRKLAEQRQELIDALAHEMRTPLTAILAGTRLLERAQLPQEKRTALLNSMAREATRLSQMDERLLQLTRLEHGELEWTAFSSREMAQEALSIFDEVSLTGEDAVFTGERELIIELLRNLVVNAQRAGGHTPVEVKLFPRGFSVTDTGCGMTREQIARAFEPFYKADKARTRHAGGAGLGLTLCKKIAQLHSGTLHMDSEVGKGTTVLFRFQNQTCVQKSEDKS